jgi:hypothetical protein
MATAVVPASRTEPRGLVLECLCTFRLAHGESDFALTRDDKCAGRLDAERGQGLPPLIHPSYIP